ncbi:MAG TPA: hypothetical protein VLV87_12360 [Gammaproteobacteria bacterium]|nr:hypothetical protein [Gammaproteobacteria bacterium]
MAQVIKLVPNETPPATRVLAEAQAEGLTDAVVIGWDKDGTLYLKSSYADGPNVLWLLEQARDIILMEGRED